MKMLKGWFEKLAREEPALYGEPAPGILIHMITFKKLNFDLKLGLFEFQGLKVYVRRCLVILGSGYT